MCWNAPLTSAHQLNVCDEAGTPAYTIIDHVLKSSGEQQVAKTSADVNGGEERGKECKDDGPGASTKGKPMMDPAHSPHAKGYVEESRYACFTLHAMPGTTFRTLLWQATSACAQPLSETRTNSGSTECGKAHLAASNQTQESRLGDGRTERRPNYYPCLASFVSILCQGATDA